MKKITSFALASVMLGTTMAGFAAPAAAQQFRFSYDSGYNDDYRWRNSDRRWDRHDRWDRHGRWDNDRRHWRRHHERDFDAEDAAAAIFGLAAGAIAGAAAGAAYDGSYERCAEAYRSFDPNTWSYLGYDGYRHRCPY
jgi:hypothetical protein